MKRIAVVTGGNRGMGLEVSRQLAQKDIYVILTSRDPAHGSEVAAQLQASGLEVQAYPLDVTQPASVEQLQHFLSQTFGRADILINNAGIIPDMGEAGILTTSIDVLQKGMETNLYGALRVTQALVPLMREHQYGRIVNVSTGMAQLAEMNGGWAGYRTSKTALNALTRILADELQGFNILVNSMCPGWVKTDMGGPNAPRTPAQGVDTMVWLALLPDDGPTGGFFRDRESIAW